MNNFEFYNPVHVVFGKGTIAKLPELVDDATTIMMVYGGGSIKKNGVYEQVKDALGNRIAIEFGGIEANPQYTTCMKAIEQVKENGIDLVLAVGGGSVLDAVKFIAAGAVYDGADPWEIFSDRGASLSKALPLGCVLTLPATGSEMNKNSVISRAETKSKLAFISPVVFPKFAILDPETTFTLPERQTANGIVDAFVHTIEQYLTYPVNSPLQDRQAEAVLRTLIEEGPKALANPTDYDARANVMWAAASALNGHLSCGVPGDWATHLIGHEMTALYGIDHARTLSVILPGVLQHQRKRKHDKLLQYGERVWGITDGDEEARITEAIEKTEAFFQSVGIKTRLSDYDIPPTGCRLMAENQARRNMKLGEHQAIGPDEIEAILSLRI